MENKAVLLPVKSGTTICHSSWEMAAHCYCCVQLILFCLEIVKFHQLKSQHLKKSSCKNSHDLCEYEMQPVVWKSWNVNRCEKTTVINNMIVSLLHRAKVTIHSSFRVHCIYQSLKCSRIHTNKYTLSPLVVQSAIEQPHADQMNFLLSGTVLLAFWDGTALCPNQ